MKAWYLVQGKSVWLHVRCAVAVGGIFEQSDDFSDADCEICRAASESIPVHVILHQDVNGMAEAAYWDDNIPF